MSAEHPVGLEAERDRSVSSENKLLLLQLQSTIQDSLREQRSENQRLHLRIDQVQQETAGAISRVQSHTTAAIDSIKDSLAKSGKVSPQFIISLIAIFASVCTLIGGMVSAYVSVRLDTLKPQIDQGRAAAAEATARVEAQAEKLTQVRIDAAITATRLEERTRAR